MFAGSLVMGLSVIGFAIWLQWNDAIGWSSESMESTMDVEYLIRRTKARSRIHLIIAGCGVLITIAAFAGPATRLWMTLWLTVILALVLIILLALLDAWRTYRYQLAKRPEIRRRTLGD